MDERLDVGVERGAVITPAEQPKLQTLLEAMHMPTFQVRQLTVTNS